MYGIFGQQEVNIRDRSVIGSGLIGSNNYVYLGVESEVQGDMISGDAVFMANHSVAAGNIHYRNTIFKQEPTYVLGTETQFTDPFVEILLARTFDVGTENININTGDAPLALAPGNYNELRMYPGTTLVLTGGVYNFNRFAMESGSSTVVFDSDYDFIEINAEQELRFGDRNTFELTEGTEPEQVQFYTNSQSQIKIGTDTTFVGVITAPFGQIYAFPRTTITGNLVGNSVWVDMEASVKPVPNCTEYNTIFDDTEIWEMSDAVSFEDDKWTITDSNGNAEVTLSDLYSSDGETSLEVTLNNDAEVTLETDVNITQVFTENATDVSVSIDVYSNTIPYSTCQSEISIYLKAADETVYTLAGTMPYDPPETTGDQMTMLTLPLSPQFTELVMTETFNVSLHISSQCDGVFWLDHLQFCDNNDGCNIQLPSLIPEEVLAEEEVAETSTVTWAGDNSEIVEDVNALEGVLQPQVDESLPCTVEFIYTAAAGAWMNVPLGNYTCSPGADIPFSVNVSNLPYDVSGMIALAELYITRSYTSSDGTIQTRRESAGSRHYRHNSNGTISHFNEQVFQETFSGLWFWGGPGYNTLPLTDENGTVIGEIVKEQESFDLNGPPPVDTDTVVDTDTTVDTATIIVE